MNLQEYFFSKLPEGLDYGVQRDFGEGWKPYIKMITTEDTYMNVPWTDTLDNARKLYDNLIEQSGDVPTRLVKFSRYLVEDEIVATQILRATQ